MSPINQTNITRTTDGKLKYSAGGIKHLLGTLVARTGGSRSLAIDADPPNSAAKDVFIPDADLVARATSQFGGLLDTYLTGMVAGEDTTMVDPRQYTVFQADKVECADVEKLGKVLHDCRPAALGENGEGGDQGAAEDLHLRDLVTFKPERMALHWVAILTAMYVKTDVPLPNPLRQDESDTDDESQKKKSDKLNEYAAWVNARDADYVAKVNQIYRKLFNIDRAPEQTKDIAVAEGADDRLQEIKEVRELYKGIKAAVNDVLATHHKAPTGTTIVTESTKRSDVLTEEECDKAITLEVCGLPEDLIAETIYRARANEVICEKMEDWFCQIVLAPDSPFKPKKFLPARERESFVLSGGSATGKSTPMAMLCQQLEHHDDETANGRKRDGFDLNDAVHMKSEVMRSLLLEPEFLNYGNRLFFDESAHDERRIIRDQMFPYIKKMLTGKAPPYLTPPGHGPVIIHDRRSTYKNETEILLSDDARLNYDYFNVPVKEALERNKGRGAADLENIQNGTTEIDPATYAPRFVNARNNIGSQESSARRMIEMLQHFAGKNIVVALYSNKVDRGDQPFIFGYGDLAHREFHVRRIPRIIEMFDNAHYKIPRSDEKTFGPLKKSLDELHGESDRRDEANINKATEWLVDLAIAKYHIFFSTPPTEKRTRRTNQPFAEMFLRDGDANPLINIFDRDLFEGIQQPKQDETHNQWPPKESRYEQFFDALRSHVDVELQNINRLPDERSWPRQQHALFAPKIESVEEWRFRTSYKNPDAPRTR